MQLSVRMLTPTCVWLSTLCFLILAFPKSGFSLAYLEFGPLEKESELKAPSDSFIDVQESTPSPELEFNSRFENRIQSYIDNGIRWQMTIISNKSRFLEEVDDYMTRLPKNASKNVTIQSRDECHCEGQMMMPCPLKCMYSCYVLNIDGRWRYEDDCRGIQLYDCLCHEYSSTTCYNKNQLLSCINQTTEYADTSCSQYSVNKPDLVRSYELTLNLLMEPLKMYFRSVESRLSFLKHASLTINSLTKIAALRCPDLDDGTCTSDVDLLLSEEKIIYHQMKRNFTLELMKIQKRIETASLKVNRLKQGTIAMINRSIKDYSCCLKNLDLTVDEYNCSDINSSYPAEPIADEPERSHPTVKRLAEKTKTVGVYESVEIECDTGLEPPVNFIWTKRNGVLLANQTSSRIVLSNVLPSDAGEYLCVASNREVKIEFPTFLVVKGTIPRFTQQSVSFLKLKPMGVQSAYLKLDILMSIKPERPDGLILYNGEGKRHGKDFIALGLRNSRVEFRFDVGSGEAVIASNITVPMGKWSNITVKRERKEGRLWVNGIGPFIGTSPGRYLGLDLFETMYLGSVPNYSAISPAAGFDTGFVGCISFLKINNHIEELSKAIEKSDVSDCDTCSESNCRNNGVCQESPNERGFQCLCPRGFTGLDCQTTGGTSACYHVLITTEAETETSMAETETPMAETETPMAETETPMAETETPMAETETPMAETETSMAETETPMAETETSMAETETPMAETETPMAETETPMAETETPMAETETPMAETETPMAETETPMAETETSMAETETPMAETETSMAETETPMAETETPMAETETPMAETETSMAEMETPMAETETPMAETETPMAETETSMAETETPMAETETPMAETETPMAETETPMAETETPMAETETPMAETETPMAETETPMAETETPMAETETSMAETETPMAETETPMAETETPMAETETPMAETETPMAETETSMAETETPMAETETPMAETETPTPMPDPRARCYAHGVSLTCKWRRNGLIKIPCDWVCDDVRHCFDGVDEIDC